VHPTIDETLQREVVVAGDPDHLLRRRLIEPLREDIAEPSLRQLDVVLEIERDQITGKE
jgi:hypothetical protein